jgi:antitoxin FitA
MIGDKLMARLIISDVEDEVKAELQRRAKRHGRSMKDEVRQILRDATKTETADRKGLGTEIATHFRNIGLRKGEQIKNLHIRIKPPDFSE